MKLCAGIRDNQTPYKELPGVLIFQSFPHLTSRLPFFANCKFDDMSTAVEAHDPVAACLGKMYPAIHSQKRG